MLFGNYTLSVTEIFENFSASKVLNSSANLSPDISDRERRSIFEDRVPEKNDSEVGRKMVEQGLLASTMT